nr:hypothetical protein [Tanacetum cinerariifolium]
MVAYLEKSDNNTEFHQIVDFLSSCSITYALTQIHAIVDGKAVVVSESLVRSDLLFDDEDDEVVNQEEGDRVERAITTNASLEAAHDSDNIIKTQTTVMPNIDIPRGIDTSGSPTHQQTMGGTSAQTMSERVLEQPKKPPLTEGHTSRSGEGRLEENIELTDTVPTPHDSPLIGGKGIMQDTELPKKLKKIKMIQLSLDEELAQKLYAKELAKEEARQEQERYNLKKALEFQRQLDQRKENIPKGDQAKEIDWNDPQVEELKLYMRIITEEDIAIEAIPLAIKPSVIIEYKIVKEGKISTYHITRADESTRRYTLMINLLENIDKEYLETLWKTVKDKYGNIRLEERYERVLWGDLKVMFELNIESEVWRQLQGHEVSVWKFFSSCGVRFVRFKNLHIFILVDKVYPLTPATIKMMLERKQQANQWNEVCYQLLKLMMK